MTVAAPYEQPALEAALIERAGQTAFDFADLRSSPDRPLGQWRARIRLRALRGIVGEAQGYALLRCFVGDLHRAQIGKEAGRETRTLLAREVWSG